MHQCKISLAINDIELLSDRAILVSDSEEGSLRTDQMVFPCSPPPPPDFKAKVAKWGGSVENLIPCTMPDENSGRRKPLSPNG